MPKGADLRTILAMRLEDPGRLFEADAPNSDSLQTLSAILSAHRAVLDDLEKDKRYGPAPGVIERFASSTHVVEIAGTDAATPQDLYLVKSAALTALSKRVFVATFTTEDQALRWAVAIQQRTQRSVASGRGARLQPAIALFHRRDTIPSLTSGTEPTTSPAAAAIVETIAQWTALGAQVDPWINAHTPELKDPAVTGGRIICFGEVYDRLTATLVHDYYHWQPAADMTSEPVQQKLREQAKGFSSRLARLSTRRPMECLYDDAQALLNAPFERVFADEIRGWIRPRRTQRLALLTTASEERKTLEEALALSSPERPHPDNNLVGLALSGGGMRSGVFSLGAVQALAHYGMLNEVDYLSTVSGGGYVGASISSLCAEKLPYAGLKRLDASRESFPFAYPRPPALEADGLRPVHGNESPALKHVRAHGKLVGRGIGLFDADTWSKAGGYLASIVLLWATFLLPAVTIVGLAFIGLRNFLSHDLSTWTWLAGSAAEFGILAVALLAISFLDPIPNPRGVVVGVVASSAAASIAAALALGYVHVPRVDGVWSSCAAAIVAAGGVLSVLSPSSLGHAWNKLPVWLRRRWGQLSAWLLKRRNQVRGWVPRARKQEAQAEDAMRGFVGGDDAGGESRPQDSARTRWPQRLRGAAFAAAGAAALLAVLAWIGSAAPLPDAVSNSRRAWSFIFLAVSGGLSVAALLCFLAVPFLPRDMRIFRPERVRTAGYAIAGAAATAGIVAVFGIVTLAPDAKSLWRGWSVVAPISPVVLFAAAAILSTLSVVIPLPRLREGLAPVCSVLARTAAALTPLLLLCGGAWGFDWLLSGNHTINLGPLFDKPSGEVVAGSTGAAGVTILGLSLGKLWDDWGKDAVTDHQDDLISIAAKVGLLVGGYLTLGTAMSAWYWFLWHTSTPYPVQVFVIGGLTSAALVVGLNAVPRVGLGLLNRLSLNATYTGMIQDAWIVAARPKSTPHANKQEVTNLGPWTEVWPRPDMRVGTLSDLARLNGARPSPAASAAPPAAPIAATNGNQHVVQPPPPPEPLGPAAPYHLICAAVNLPGSTSAKLLDRVSDSFVIAPIWSGSALTHWSRTTDRVGGPPRHPAHIDEMPLAQAAAISGAAVSPNMGTHTTTTLSIITTLLNIRMGYWLSNARPSPAPATQQLLTDLPLVLYWKEMLGRASHEDGQIYLSDGGHFENLGLYELLRRRCKYIIAVSADVGSMDEPFDMGNLGAALRLARVDFGVEVEMGSLVPLMHDPKTGGVLSFFSAGKLTYPDASSKDKDANVGTLIFIKTGVIEQDLSADLLQYWKNHPNFPYDSTSDQQYDQPRFESYRQLGYLATRAMWESLGEAEKPPAHAPRATLLTHLKKIRQRHLGEEPEPGPTTPGVNGQQAAAGATTTGTS